MRSLFCAALLCAAPVFAADALSYKTDGLSVRLLQDECTAPVVDMIREDMRALAKAAEVVFQGQAYRACWVPAGANAHILDETGDEGPIPMNVFQRDSGV